MLRKRNGKSSISRVSCLSARSPKRTDNYVDNFLTKHKLEASRKTPKRVPPNELNDTSFEAISPDKEIQELKKRNKELVNYINCLEHESTNLESQCREMCSILKAANTRISEFHVRFT